jgi:HAE1 family hydrophobic/amphiphilic exporter-1
MAKVILGGQLLSLLLSLLVTPVAYSLWDDLTHRLRRVAGWFGRRAGRPAPPHPTAVAETTVELPVVATGEARTTHRAAS